MALFDYTVTIDDVEVKFARMNRLHCTAKSDDSKDMLRFTLDYSTEPFMPKIKVNDVRRMLLVDRVVEAESVCGKDDDDTVSGWSIHEYNTVLRGTVFKMEKDQISISLGALLLIITDLKGMLGPKLKLDQTVFLLITARTKQT